MLKVKISRLIHCTITPKMKESTTESRILDMMARALVELIKSPTLAIFSTPSTIITASLSTLRKAIPTAAPSMPNTNETVVEVGRPKVLKKSSRSTSVNMTARKRMIISEKRKYWGKNKPLRATSIMPLEKRAPTSMPALATIMIMVRVAAFDPNAELRKLTASLATPTIRSEMARQKSTTTKNI